MEALSLSMAPQVELRANAALVASMELLALPAAELEELVEQELAANPALERLESPQCRSCGAPLEGGRCLDCAPRRQAGAELPERESPSEPTLADALLADLRLQLAQRDQRIASYLVGSLDEHGFLRAELDEVAAALDVPTADVARVLSVLQETAPPGVAAHDVRECLLLQLDRAELPQEEYALARAVVADGLADLARGRYAAVAAALGVARSRVLEVRDLIRTQLRPFPILPGTPAWAQPVVPPSPEVVVRAHPERPSAYEVEVVERRRIAVTVSPAYLQLDQRGLTKSERAVVGEQLAEARALVDRLERRWATIKLVVEQVVERQRDFVEHGSRELRPLTRRAVAAELGLHESTVGRAVTGRHALLPSRRVVALTDFFDDGVAVRDALRDAVAAERRPLSDGELACALAHDGFTLSRRTVAKYRAQLGIPAHARR